MKVLSIISLLVVAALPALAQEEPPLPPLEEETIAEDTSLKALGLVQTYMDTVQSLEADFIQYAPDGGVAKGKLSLARPGRVRFDYEDDIPFLVVADGKTLNFIDYEIGQVTRWPVGDTPLRALLGGSTDLASIGANIEVAPFDNPELVALHAVDVERPELGHITVYFQQQPYVDQKLRLLRWDVTDAQGQITSVELLDSKINVELAEKLWEFDDPRGLARRRRPR
ncbi:MAG: outer-membrane lipoprotein carrier protein LolA [Kordiimonadaceae bacterium]|nr:outer-membrane lipoprotein carrier protein LolA [Kordiimonadaceae bacterium]MBO6568332.1 outer-membrane lipoprotein carrier protein LolA [Kordiimonadaceae bacterium]MBO6963938.1 outer-membrane lipoprotein carrier protein LolA [Kordiimonadaceae bacterium]